VSSAADSRGELRCKNHPKRETRLRCSKCDEPICTRCLVQTPVGYRCRECAQLRKLPQFSVGPSLLARAVPAGLLISVLCWFVASFVPYLGFFVAILVGVAVSEVMGRLALRRSNRWLEACAVLCVVTGMIIAYTIQGLRFGERLSTAGSGGIALLLRFALPLVIASFVAVVRLR